MKKYDRVMPRVYNRSRSSLKSSSLVTRHQTSPSSVVGAKPSVSNVSSGVFSDLPVVLNDYKLEPEKVARRPLVVKPRKTLKSLDPALSPPRSVRRSQELRPKPRYMRSRGSAPCVLGPVDEKWTESHMRQCLSSRSHTRLKELKVEIKAYEDKGKMMKLRSELFQKCGVLLDDTGLPAEDKAVQVETDAAVRKKWKNLRDYFFRQVKELEKSRVNIGGNETADVVSFRYCLWPLYEKLKFLISDSSQRRKYRPKMTEEDFKILEEVTNDTNLNASDPLLKEDTMETIIFQCPTGDTPQSGDDDSDDCELVSVESVKLLLSTQTNIPTSAASASQYLPPPLKKIAPKLPTIPVSGQSNEKVQAQQKDTRHNRTQPILLRKNKTSNQETQQLQQMQEQTTLTKQLTQELQPQARQQQQQKTSNQQTQQQHTITNQLTPELQAQLLPQQQKSSEQETHKKHTTKQITQELQPQPRQQVIFASSNLGKEPTVVDMYQNASLKTMLSTINPPPLLKLPPLKRAKKMRSDSHYSDEVPGPSKRHESNDADFQFFKSLMPFMKELPLKSRLRVRNSIQHLILSELESIEQETKNFDDTSDKESTSVDCTSVINIDESSNDGKESDMRTSVTFKEEMDVDIIDDVVVDAEDCKEIKTELESDTLKK